MPSDSLSFSASYDSTTKIISTVVCCILVGVAILTHGVIVAGLAAALIIMCYAYSPRAYTVQDGAILVNRLIGSVRIPLDGIREIREARADDLEGCIRLFGNGGLFGYYGLFRTSKLGNSWWYVTNSENDVVVLTNSKTFVLSPDDADRFVATVRPALTPRTLPTAPPQISASTNFKRLIPKVIVSVVMIAGLSFGLFCVLYSPGPPTYTLTPLSLKIHDRFYPIAVNAADVDIEHIRVVDLGVDTNWQPTERANGFANSHYRSGLFRLANRQKVHLYRADSKRLVLLPPKGNGTPVLLETNEPEKLVQRLRQEWSNRM